MNLKQKEVKLLSDRDLIETIKDLILIKHFTYNKCIIEGLDLIIWQFIIDHLKNNPKTRGK